jgi:hypothetical protein
MSGQRIQELGAPRAPGSFAFADDDRLTQLLAGGGFREVRLETHYPPVPHRPHHRATPSTSYFPCRRASSCSPYAPQDTVDVAATALHAGLAP